MGKPNKNIPALKVRGTKLTNASGAVVALRGISTLGFRYPEYFTKESFETFRDEWKADTIRLALYTDEPGGYCTDGDKDELKKLMLKGVDIATELGMYVIVDWHILFDKTPMLYKDEAVKFFEEMSSLYKDYTNVIYEICNEPQESPFKEVIRPYAEEIIGVIRKNDKDALIIVGTNTWSQDVDEVIGNKCSDENVMYSLHFYATSHRQALRDKAKKAMDEGVPVFISECSICDASGNGEIDYDEAKLWMDFAAENDMSYIVWNLSNKDESSAFIKPEVKTLSHWSDEELSDTGRWFKKEMSAR